MNVQDSQVIAELEVAEYTALKSEQAQRIAFRDNILFVHIAACGAVGSWGIASDSANDALNALLIIPWLSVVLGWTYLVNDHAISMIGLFFRTKPCCEDQGSVKLDKPTSIDHNSTPLYWEIFHRTDSRRSVRKRVQYAIDTLTFSGSGIASISCFFYIKESMQFPTILIGVFEALLMVWLAVEIYLYADFDAK